MTDPPPPDPTPSESEIEARGHVTPAPSSSDTVAKGFGRAAISHDPAADVENFDPAVVALELLDSLG